MNLIAELLNQFSHSGKRHAVIYFHIVHAPTVLFLAIRKKHPRSYAVHELTRPPLACQAPISRPDSDGAMPRAPFLERPTVFQF